MKEHGLYINGKWVKPANRQTFITKNPATGEPLVAFFEGTRADVAQAIEAAEKAFSKWK